jgi:hypothetical protein
MKPRSMPYKELHTYGMENDSNITPLWKLALFSTFLLTSAHLPFNPSTTDPAIVVIARTDPNEQESVELLPELDAIHSAGA